MERMVTIMTLKVANLSSLVINNDIGEIDSHFLAGHAEIASEISSWYKNAVHSRHKNERYDCL